MQRLILYVLLQLFLFPALTSAQSLEVMVGHERVFVDSQWFRYLSDQRRWSIFSRTRATVDYDNNTDLFTGAYLNYTTTGGIGGSLIGRIGQTGGGADAGIHYLKVSKDWSNFALVSAGLKDHLEYSWFSISRYTPNLTPRTKLYTSLELFSLFRQGNHLASVQRLRVGLQIGQAAFGAALNFAEVGAEWSGSNNLGGFFRKSF